MSARYSIVKGWEPFDNTRFAVLEAATEEQLTKWANDPNCKEREAAEEELSNRRSHKAFAEAAVRNREAALTARKEQLVAQPFDPRTERSEDAKYIVRTLWIIFALLPFIIGFLLWLSKRS